MPSWAELRGEPFETLVNTILSQNTADTNSTRAYESLSKRFEIKPEVLAKANIGEIEEAIKVSGLYKNKAQNIKQSAIIICKKYHGSLKPVLSLPLEEARSTLMQFPGVGPKTADVVLLFSADQATIPVDTHVKRVTKRLGFAPVNANYETIRQNLQSLYKPADYLAVHILLIMHGRKYCKALHPLHNECPINSCCPSRSCCT
ncbi:MAG TPA: endonuclease III [Candidatus Sulfotelmatobacter sp.]|nr:endonuclease III [Candidatus Sulfotelmatobacter sp.]